MKQTACCVVVAVLALAGGWAAAQEPADTFIIEGIPAGLEEAVAAAGGTVLPVVTDVSSAEAIQALADKTIERFGGVHLLFNNAGKTALANREDEMPTDKINRLKMVVCQLKSTKEIAELINFCAKTIKCHRDNIDGFVKGH